MTSDSLSKFKADLVILNGQVQTGSLANNLKEGLFLEIGASKEFNLIEIFNQESANNNLDFQFKLMPNSKFKHTHIYLNSSLKIKRQGTVVLQQDAQYQSFAIDLGPNNTEINLNINLQEKGSSTLLKGLYALSENAHSQHYSIIRHQAPFTSAEQEYRGLLGGNARAVFNGMIKVEKGSHGVISGQKNHNLLLGEKARVESCPTLIIENEDVKCNHGSTVGQLSLEQLFYLQCRGIDEKAAKKLLALGFAQSILEDIPTEELCNWTKEQFNQLELFQ